MKNERLLRIRGSETQLDFAKRIGIHKNTVARYEAGVREPDGEYLKTLAVLGWSPLWVLTGMGEPRLPPGMRPNAAVDAALVVAHGDTQAEARRQARTEGLADGQRMAEESEAYSASPPVRPDAYILAVTMIDKALADANRVLASEKRAEAYLILAELIADEAELPNAKVVALAIKSVA